MKRTGRLEIADLADVHRQAGGILGYSVDDERNIVEFFVPDDAPSPALPAAVGGYDVVVVPLPRPRRDGARTS